MPITPSAREVPVRDRWLLVAGTAWIATSVVFAFAAARLADALFLLVFIPLLAVAAWGGAVLLWAAVATTARSAAGRPLGRAPHVLAAVALTALGGLAGGWRWFAGQGDIAILRLRRATYARIVADLRAGAVAAAPGAHVTVRGVAHVVVLTSAPLRVAFLQPVGFAGDPTEWVVYDPTGAVRGGPGADAVPGPMRNSAGFQGCEPVAEAYYRCWAE